MAELGDVARPAEHAGHGVSEPDQFMAAVEAVGQRLDDVRGLLVDLLDDDVADQSKDLDAAFARCRRWLVVLSSGAVLAVAVLLAWAPGSSGGDAWATARVVALSIVAGVAGSSIAALQSLLDRRSHGLELRFGRKVPPGGKPDRFSERMAPWFLARPVLGAFAGLVVYAGPGLVGDRPDDVLGMTFVALLAGLFAKTLIVRLKAVFDALLGG